MESIIIMLMEISIAVISLVFHKVRVGPLPPLGLVEPLSREPLGGARGVSTWWKCRIKL